MASHSVRSRSLCAGMSGQLEIQNRLSFSTISSSGFETMPSDFAQHSMSGSRHDFDALALLGAWSISRDHCQQGAGGPPESHYGSLPRSYNGRFVKRYRRLKHDTSARYSSDGWDEADTVTQRLSKTLVGAHGIPKPPLRLSTWENENERHSWLPKKVPMAPSKPQRALGHLCIGVQFHASHRRPRQQDCTSSWSHHHLPWLLLEFGVIVV